MDKLYQTISLDNNAGNLAEIFKKIDDNFRLLIESQYAKGIKGDSLEIGEVKLKDNGKLTSIGKDAITAIYKGISIYNEDEAAEELPESVIGYYIVRHDGQEPNPKLVYTAYQTYTDYRFKTTIDPKDDNWKDASCVFFGTSEDGETLKWTTDSKHIPTIGYNKDLETWTWRYGDIDTNVPCQGVKGNDGAGSKLNIFQSSTIDKDRNIVLIEKIWGDKSWDDKPNSLEVNTFAFIHYVENNILTDIYFGPIVESGDPDYKYGIDISNTKGLSSVYTGLVLNTMLGKIKNLNDFDYSDPVSDGLWIPNWDKNDTMTFRHVLKQDAYVESQTKKVGYTDNLVLEPTDKKAHTLYIKYNLDAQETNTFSKESYIGLVQNENKIATYGDIEKVKTELKEVETVLKIANEKIDDIPSEYQSLYDLCNPIGSIKALTPLELSYYLSDTVKDKFIYYLDDNNTWKNYKIDTKLVPQRAICAYLFNNGYVEELKQKLIHGFVILIDYKKYNDKKVIGVWSCCNRTKWADATIVLEDNVSITIKGHIGGDNLSYMPDMTKRVIMGPTDIYKPYNVRSLDDTSFHIEKTTIERGTGNRNPAEVYHPNSGDDNSVEKGTKYLLVPNQALPFFMRVPLDNQW